MNLSIGKSATAHVGKSIMVTGSARSGTTIMGQLLASCRGVEYGFEPPTLVSLFAVLNMIPISTWKLLYETYIYEELLLGSMAGRYLNTNRADDSSAYNYMTQSEIDRRMTVSARKQTLESQLATIQLHACFKIPDLLPVIPTISSLYPEMKIVVMRRSPQSTIHSLLQKGWFNPGGNGDRSTRVYPFRQLNQNTVNQLHIPYWVAMEDEQWWIEADAIQRCLYYYILNTPSSESNCLVVSYEQLLADPQATFESTIKYLEIESDVMTSYILSSVKPQKQSYQLRALGGDPYKLRAKLPTLPSTLYEAAQKLDLWET